MSDEVEVAINTPSKVEHTEATRNYLEEAVEVACEHLLVSNPISNPPFPSPEQFFADYEAEIEEIFAQTDKELLERLEALGAAEVKKRREP